MLTFYLQTLNKKEQLRTNTDTHTHTECIMPAQIDNSARLQVQAKVNNITQEQEKQQEALAEQAKEQATVN